MATYTTAEITEATGVSLRTIRLWTSKKLLPPPSGRGPGTRYTEEHRLLLRFIASLREDVHNLAVIRNVLRRTPREELYREIGEEPPPVETMEENDEQEEPPPGAEANAPLPPPAPKAAPPLPGRNGGSDPAPPAIEQQTRIGDAALPGGQKWVIVGLLPQLALMVGEGASPLVRRIAAEICREYGQE